jgi:hypothetical protein
MYLETFGQVGATHGVHQTIRGQHPQMNKALLFTQQDKYSSEYG